jgi:predicted ABC-type transport system involved in lysophospholipase L1 biosynthesis ATPase subunit
LVDRAVSAGVINGDNATRATYRAAYEKDPAGTRSFLSQLGLRDEVEHAEADYPDAYLTPGEHQRVAAAREGKRSRIHNAQD